MIKDSKRVLDGMEKCPCLRYTKGLNIVNMYILCSDYDDFKYAIRRFT